MMETYVLVAGQLEKQTLMDAVTLVGSGHQHSLEGVD